MFEAGRLLNRWCAATAMTAFALTLGACVATSSLDDLATATPTGSPFSQALFKDYSYLAQSFGPGNSGGTLDIEDSLFGSGDETDQLAEAFATKALIAAKGVEVEPEPASSDAAASRDRLVRDVQEGMDRFPVDAARAQADFDCWMLNSTVDSQRAAAQQCQISFNGTLARLEQDLHPPTFVPPPAPAAAASANFTVYFELNSWTLTGEQLTTLQQAIAAARAGQQAHISIVGHTDTSGSADYNQKLSVKRANVVAETLVDMGARREALEISGVGEADLAVQTGDGVKEPKNRRAVVTLQP